MLLTGTYYNYGPLFFPEPIAFCTSRLADAIAADGMVVDSDSFGSGRPSIGFKLAHIIHVHYLHYAHTSTYNYIADMCSKEVSKCIYCNHR